MEIFCYILNVFYVNFDQLYVNDDVKVYITFQTTNIGIVHICVVCKFGWV